MLLVSESVFMGLDLDPVHSVNMYTNTTRIADTGGGGGWGG